MRRVVVLVQTACLLAASAWAGSATPLASPCDACRIILLDPGAGPSGAPDATIAETQRRIQAGEQVSRQLEKLGWLYVGKARSANDPGFYKLAEQCAICLQSHEPDSLAALLLRGHVLQSLHRFKEAQPLALQLTSRRGSAADYGLLGDVSFDQGSLPAAIEAYQKMVNLRPDLESYSRVAQVRWITGDVSGAVEAMSLAAGAASPLNAEAGAWVYARRALWQLQLGATADALRSARSAVRLQSNHAAAWLALGRVQMALGQTNDAAYSIGQSATLLPLPEAQWLLADCWRQLGERDRARDVEKELDARGVVEDPRAFSLYLSTRGAQTGLALDLARRELDVRQDVFTHDALAWALQANGQWAAARSEMDQALAVGTQDARLFLHAAVILSHTGDPARALQFARQAARMPQMLYPSELERLPSADGPVGQVQQHASIIKSN